MKEEIVVWDLLLSAEEPSPTRDRYSIDSRTKFHGQFRGFAVTAGTRLIASNATANARIEGATSPKTRVRAECVGSWHRGFKESVNGLHETETTGEGCLETLNSAMDTRVFVRLSLK